MSEKNKNEAAEYDLLKHRLASDALGIALWDVDSDEGIPIRPDTKVIWSSEFRGLLGFCDENDFPDLLVPIHNYSIILQFFPPFCRVQIRPAYYVAYILLNKFFPPLLRKQVSVPEKFSQSKFSIFFFR